MKFFIADKIDNHSGLSKGFQIICFTFLKSRDRLNLLGPLTRYGSNPLASLGELTLLGNSKPNENYLFTLYKGIYV